MWNGSFDLPREAGGDEGYSVWLCHRSSWRMKSWQDFHRAFGNTRTLVSSSLCKLSVPTDRSTSEPQTSAPPALYGAILGTAHSSPNKVEIYCPVCSTEAPCQLLRTDVKTHARCSARQTPPLSAWSLIQPHADRRFGACPLSAPPPVCVCVSLCFQSHSWQKCHQPHQTLMSIKFQGIQSMNGCFFFLPSLLPLLLSLRPDRCGRVCGQQWRLPASLRQHHGELRMSVHPQLLPKRQPAYLHPPLWWYVWPCLTSLQSTLQHSDHNNLIAIIWWQ